MTDNATTDRAPSPAQFGAARILSRRTALASLGVAGAAAFLAACGSGNSSSDASASPTPSTTAGSSTSGATTTTTPTSTTTGSCVLTAEQEQGPYWYPAAAIRSDITDGKPGVPLHLRFTVMDVKKCAPVENAAVDVWHADALGAYSDTSSGLFLRGIQLTDTSGVASFTSIYPGWYPRRTNHVHVKIHIGGTENADHYTGGHVSHTGNVFFPEDVSIAVAGLAPYTSNTATRVTLDRDFVYTGQNGSGSILSITPIDASAPDKGYVATMVLGVDPDATPAGIGISGTVS